MGQWQYDAGPIRFHSVTEVKLHSPKRVARWRLLCNRKGLFFSGIQYCQFLFGFVYERSQTKPNAHLTDAAESESKPNRVSPTFVRTLP